MNMVRIMGNMGMPISTISIILKNFGKIILFLINIRKKELSLQNRRIKHHENGSNRHDLRYQGLSDSRG